MGWCLVYFSPFAWSGSTKGSQTDERTSWTVIFSYEPITGSCFTISFLSILFCFKLFWVGFCSSSSCNVAWSPLRQATNNLYPTPITGYLKSILQFSFSSEIQNCGTPSHFRSFQTHTIFSSLKTGSINWFLCGCVPILPATLSFDH